MFPRLYILHAKRAVSPESKVTLPGLNLSSISVAVLPTEMKYLELTNLKMLFFKYVSLSSLIIHIGLILHELQIPLTIFICNNFMDLSMMQRSRSLKAMEVERWIMANNGLYFKPWHLYFDIWVKRNQTYTLTKINFYAYMQHTPLILKSSAIIKVK